MSDIAKPVARMLLALALLPAQTAGAGRLPGWVCNNELPPPPPQFACQRAGLRCQDPPAPAFRQEPSHGEGGAYPGAVTRNVQFGSPTVFRSYYAYLPNGYAPATPLPVLMVLHGAAGSGTAPTNARLLRDAWIEVAEDRGFIVAAPIATGSGGGWVPERDYLTMAAVLEDLAAHYNIDRSRIHAWGFSAGGHVLHDIALNQWLPNLGIDTFAAYAVAAGVLEAYACDSATSCNVLLDAAARRIPLTLRVGVSDPYRDYMQSNRDRFAARGWALGDTLGWAVLDGGHEVVTADFDAVWSFLCPFQHLHESQRPARAHADRLPPDRPK